MKVLMRPIEMIAWFTKDGIPTPIKYKLMNDDKLNAVICVHRVVSRTQEKIAGNKMFVYRCQSTIDGVEKMYELKYELNTCTWFLFKM